MGKEGICVVGEESVWESGGVGSDGRWFMHWQTIEKDDKEELGEQIDSYEFHRI